MSAADDHKYGKGRQKRQAAPSESWMQTPVFKGVKENANNRSDFGKADHFPQAACMKEMQRNAFEKASDSRKKETTGSENHQALVDVATVTKVKRSSNKECEGQAAPKVQSERANTMNCQ
ncbi:MAG: hypothetical protein ACYDD2_06765 [Candidatus Acidiferrales bacterium]